MSTSANSQTACEPAVACTDWFGILKTRLSARERELFELADRGLALQEICMVLKKPRGYVWQIGRQIRWKMERAKEAAAAAERLHELFPNTLLSDRRGAGSLEQIVGASGPNHAKPQ